MAPSSRPGERREGWIEREREREREEGGEEMEGRSGREGRERRLGERRRGGGGEGERQIILNCLLVSPRSST